MYTKVSQRMLVELMSIMITICEACTNETRGLIDVSR